MVFGWKARLRVWLSITLMITVYGCRKPAGSADSPPAPGEPEQYSATVVRTTDDGSKRETVIAREARAGELRREEWFENGQNRALIWRPDIGKAFLLDLDRRVYAETNLYPPPKAPPTSHGLPTARKSPVDEVNQSSLEAIEGYFEEKQQPARVENQALSAAIIEGRSCDVYQQIATFPDGKTEITRRFYSRELSGLLLRLESEAGEGPTRVIIERRDIRLEVSRDTFEVPADFKRVEELPR